MHSFTTVHYCEEGEEQGEGRTVLDIHAVDALGHVLGDDAVELGKVWQRRRTHPHDKVGVGEAVDDSDAGRVLRWVLEERVGVTTPRNAERRLLQSRIVVMSHHHRICEAPIMVVVVVVVV